MASASLSDRFRRAVQSDDLISAKRIYERALMQGETSNGTFDIRNQTIASGSVMQQPTTHSYFHSSSSASSSSSSSRPLLSDDALGMCPALSASQYSIARQRRVRERNREAGRTKSSLALAVENGASVEMIQWLLDIGHERSDFSRDSRGCTAVSLAAQYNRTDVIEACCIDAVAHAATLHHQRSLMYGFRALNLNAYEDEEDEDEDRTNADGEHGQHDISDSDLSPAMTLVTAAASTPSRRPSPNPSAVPKAILAEMRSAIQQQQRRASTPKVDEPSSENRAQMEGNALDNGLPSPGPSELDDIVGVTIQRLLDCPDELGRTALALASMKGHEASVRLLLDLGATVDLGDYEGNRPLHYASAFNQLIVVQALIERGCSFAVKNMLGFTAADYAWNLALKSALEAFARAHFDVKRIRGRYAATAAAGAASAAGSQSRTMTTSPYSPNGISNGAHDSDDAQKSVPSASSTVGLFPAALRTPDHSLPPSPHTKLTSQLRDIF